MAGTKVENILLTAGQNEGIDVSVLPAPQFSSANNMRLRKGSRWGKRFGHTALPTANLGSGTGLIRSIGGGKGGALTCFALVDDKCSVYNQTAGAFVVGTGPKAGAASGWLPDTSYFPVPPLSLQYQTTTPSAIIYAFGYLWTVIEFINPAATADRMLRIVATDPGDQTVARIDDFTASTATFGGNRYPKLLMVGTTLVLTYALNIAGAVVNIIGRSLTGIGAAWSAENVLGAGVGAVYDASGYSGLFFSVAIAAPASSVQLFGSTFAAGPAQAIADVSGNPLTEISVVGSSAVAGGEIYVGYACAATPASKVRVFTANLAGTVGTASVSITAARRPLLALQPGGVVAVFQQSVTATVGSFAFRTVSAAAALGGSVAQNSFYPISMPFTVGAQTYIWAKTETGGASYATLLRLVNSLYCTIELSSQDYIVDSGFGATATDSRGLPVPVQIGTTAAYAVPVPTLYSTVSSLAALGFSYGHDFRVLQVKHYSDSANRRSVPAIYADSSSFLPMGALTRVDDRGAVEEGFIHAPTIGTITPAAGAGALTPSSDYYYTAIYKSRNSNGRFEVSAPATPVKITMGVGQNQNTVNILSLGLTARSNTAIEVYRTLSNGQTFYLAATLDSGTGFIAILDQLADSLLQTQSALYTQVGQTLPNAFPPPARFGCVGGQRLFLGGQIRPDVVQASKLIFGDQSPSFADSDAFRIVLPAPCTGIAWMDTLCMFTAEGIYIASGDGPDDSGVGDFGNLTRMPYELGCIEPRSIITVDDGTFFQTARGLYLLPRGFGAPVPAGDNVQNTLANLPVITGCVALTKASEQSVHWTCSDTSGVGGGARIVYDLAHKAWNIDTISLAECGAGNWSANEVALFHATVASPLPLLVTSSGFDDASLPISMTFSTGQLRPFGVLSEGSIIKFQILAELRAACTMGINTFTEWGGNSTSRVFALAGGDYTIGQLTVTDVELGPTSAREAVRVQAQISETSTTEGLAFIAVSLEHEQGEGLKRASPLSRVT